MKKLTIREVPELRDPTMVMAFGGWPDAGEGATQAVRYLVRKLKAVPFADIDPEDFYDFTQTRPNTFLNTEGVRRTQWPTNKFYYWQNATGERDLVLFSGIEPNLRWRTYTSLVINVMEHIHCRRILHLGALLDAVPHTRDTILTGSSNNPDLRKTLEEMGAPSSSYEGPTGITSAIWESVSRRGMMYASVWGHAPHYLHATPNFKVSHALLAVVNRLLRVPVRLEDMKKNIAAFEREVENVVAEDEQIQTYVKRLEEHFDRAYAGQPRVTGEIPTPEEVVKDLEEFLKQEQRKNGDEKPEA
jgi:proteasome assembly chaperone (PAC2) family protein